ncbi:MAG TPA: sulfite exporter TauE/SafE family protein, partial [Nocardioidaceae bacterium]
NVSNTIGLVPGSVSGAVGYRRELRGQRGRLTRLASASLVGGIAGAVLLLALPAEAFSAIVPLLILVGVVLVIFQPTIARKVASRAENRGGVPEHGALWVWVLVMLAGVYGGYFGAAQGVLLMAIMGIGIQDSLQRLNGTKNVLAGLVNGVAAVVFILVADVDWVIAGLIAAGSIVGGQIGATVGRRLPPLVLRLVIVMVGTVAIVAFVW